MYTTFVNSLSHDKKVKLFFISTTDNCPLTSLKLERENVKNEWWAAILWPIVHNQNQEIINCLYSQPKVQSMVSTYSEFIKSFFKQSGFQKNTRAPGLIVS